MRHSIQYRFEQAKCLLFSLSVFNAYLPVIAFSFTTIMFAFVYSWKLDILHISDTGFSKADYVMRSVCDCSLFALLIMLINAKYYKWLSWLCWCCLFVIWALNLFYVSMDMECDFYYAAYIIIIYLTFVVITVGKVFIRC